MKICLILILFITAACHSPINHQVKSKDGVSEKLKNETRFSKLNLNLSYEWLVGPSGDINQTNTLMVIVRNSNNAITDLPEGLTLSFYAMMPSMGHPLDDPGYFKKIDQGIYINKSIKYNMGGEWKNELWVLDEQLNIKDKAVWQSWL